MTDRVPSLLLSLSRANVMGAALENVLAVLGKKRCSNLVVR